MAYEVLEPEAELPGYEVIEPEEMEASRVKNDYIAKGGNQRDVLSPERQKVFDDEVRRQQAQGATPQQAVTAASAKVDEMPVIGREDGTIAAGFKPTEQAKAEGIIEQGALPAVEAAQRQGVATVSSTTTRQGGGVAVGADRAGNTVKVETDKDGNPLPGYEVVEEETPSRLGAIARTVASEVIPTTIGGLAARAGSLVPGPAPLKFGAGLVAGTAGYFAGRKAQEAAGAAILGPERMQRINEVLQQDREAYPMTTLGAAVLTPTIGGAVALGGKAVQAVRGLGQRGAQEAVEAASPKVAEEVVAKASEELPPVVSLPKPGPGQAQRATPKRVAEDPTVDPAVAKAVAEGDVLYNTKGWKQAEREVRELSFDEQRVLAQKDDFMGKAAKLVIVDDAVKQGNAKLAREYMDMIAPKGTEMGQAINLFKIISTSPAGYVFALDDLLAKRGYQLTEPLNRKAVNLFRVQAAAKGRFERLAEKARNSLDNADITAATKAERVFLESFYRLSNFEARLVPKRIFGETLPTALQGNLLTPLSLFVNLWSNAVNAIPRAVGRQSAFVVQEIGRAFNKLRGVKNQRREIASPLGKGTAERMRATVSGFARGLGEGLVGLRRGISAEGLLAGEKIRGMQPIQAFKQLWRTEDLAKAIKPSIKQEALDKLRLGTEAVLGVTSETMLRLLQLGDSPFRRMAQARLLTEAGQLAGQSAKATRVATRFPTEKTLSRIEQEAAEAVFQQDTALSRAALAISNLGKAGDKAGFARFVGKTIIPYAKTPANVIDELLDFSLPGWALTKVYSKKERTIREVNMAWGKTLAGTVIGGTALYLSKQGILGGKPADSEKQRDLQYQTLPPRTINITALQRLAEGESTDLQPGDRVIALEKMGIVGAMLAVAQAITDAGQSPPEDVATFTSLVPETLSFAFNQSFLKGTNSLLTAMLDGDGAKLDKWVTDYYGTISGVAIPNTLSAVSRSMRETMPDKIQIKDVEGEGPDRYINLFGEILKRRLPGMDEDIARRVDIWGRDVPQTPEGADPVAYNFLDVTKGREVAYDKITLGIYRLFKETEDGDVIPPKPGRNFTLEDATYRLTPDLYEEYARARGQANRKVAEALFADPGFRRMTTADKVRALKAGYNQTSDDVREAFIAKNGRRIRLGERQ